MCYIEYLRPVSYPYLYLISNGYVTHTDRSTKNKTLWNLIYTRIYFYFTFIYIYIYLHLHLFHLGNNIIKLPQGAHNHTLYKYETINTKDVENNLITHSYKGNTIHCHWRWLSSQWQHVWNCLAIYKQIHSDTQNRYI